MDMVAYLQTTTLAQFAPWVAACIAVATAIMLVLPAPTVASSAVYLTVYNFVHLIANLKAAPGGFAPVLQPISQPSTATASPGASTSTPQAPTLAAAAIVPAVLVAVLVALALVLSACSAAKIETTSATVQADVQATNAAALTIAKTACPGLRAAAPGINATADIIGAAAGAGAPVTVGTTVAAAVLNVGCTAVEAAPAPVTPAPSN